MLYGYGLFIAAFLIGGTVLLAIGLNRAREWWESRRDRRRTTASESKVGSPQPGPPPRSVLPTRKERTPT